MPETTSRQAATAVLHYFYDPLCGWCYGAAPLAAVAARLPGLALVLHGGGLMSGPARRRAGPEFRAYVAAHDARIAALTGQPFSAAYRDGLLADPALVLDSTPPIAAVLAAGAVGGNPAAFLAALQQAHYVDGRPIGESATLAALAAEQGLPAEPFAAALAGQLAGQLAGPVEAHIAESRCLMADIGATGFPTFVISTGEWRQVLDLGAYWGQPEGWEGLLRSFVRGVAEG